MTERQKHYLVIAMLGLTTLPFFFIVNMPAWGRGVEELRSQALYLSAVFGYIGVSLLIWELALGTRAVAGLYFIDLVSKLRLHHWLGTYGVLLIFLHPLLIVYSYGESLAYAIVPSLGGNVETHVTYGRFALMGLLLIWMTSAVVRSRMAYRPWKYLHYLSYPLLVFSLLHVPAIGSSFGAPWVRFYWLVFCWIAICCFALRAAHFFGYGKLAYRIRESYALAPEIFFLRMAPMERGISIRTGQYAYVQLRMFGEEHPFSVLDHNDASGEFSIAFKVSGRFTDGLSRVPSGDVVMIDGPYGTFTRELEAGSGRPPVFIAGGIGITPFVRHALLNPQGSHVFSVNQTRQTAVFRQLLRERLDTRFIEVFSRESAQLAGANEESGHLNEAILSKYLPNPQEHDYYICGPRSMMQAAISSLGLLGVPMSQIRSEEFGF